VKKRWSDKAGSGGRKEGPACSSSLRHFVAFPLASSFPISDWQFWVVTAVFLVAAAWLLKGVLPIPWLSKRAKRKKGTKQVSLTIGGKAPDKH
jgi:hypothetical protein